jgi:hypothetical protein
MNQINDVLLTFFTGKIALLLMTPIELNPSSNGIRTPKDF